MNLLHLVTYILLTASSTIPHSGDDYAQKWNVDLSKGQEAVIVFESSYPNPPYCVYTLDGTHEYIAATTDYEATILATEPSKIIEMICVENTLKAAPQLSFQARSKKMVELFDKGAPAEQIFAC